jgi:hypothetical protein
MSQKIKILHRTLWVLGTAFALTLGMSSIASAQAPPAWDNEYVGGGVSKFEVNSCGKLPVGSVIIVANLWGPGLNPSGFPSEYGTWGIDIDSPFNRFAGTINHTSGNGKKLYLQFFPVTRSAISSTLQTLKGEVCGISPLPDTIVFTQAVIKTNKMGTKIQTKIRAKYGAIVNEGGSLKQAQWRFNSTAVAVY